MVITEKDLRIMDEAVARPRIRRQFTRTGKLQALDDCLRQTNIDKLRHRDNYIHARMYIYLYIYIYIERERERDSVRFFRRR